MNAPLLPSKLIAMLKRMDADELVAAAPSAATIVKAIATEDVREMALGGGHKIRCRYPDFFTDAEIAQSRQWLDDRGLSVEPVVVLAVARPEGR